MYIPDKLRIGAHDFKVVQVPESDLRDEETDACVCHDQLLISIREDVPDSYKIELLLHEMIHALLSGSKIDGDEEEKVATQLGEGLTQFLSDNPDFVRSITQELWDRE